MIERWFENNHLWKFNKSVPKDTSGSKIGLITETLFSLVCCDSIGRVVEAQDLSATGIGVITENFICFVCCDSDILASAIGLTTQTLCVCFSV